MVDDVHEAAESRAATRARLDDYLMEPVDPAERVLWLREKAEREMGRRRAQIERQASRLVSEEDLEEPAAPIEVEGIGPIHDPNLVQD